MKIVFLLLLCLLVVSPAGGEEEGSALVAVRTERLRQALAVDPGNHQLHYRLGLNLLMDNQPTEALAHLVRAYPFDPLSPEMNFNLALAYERSGDVDSALIHLEQAERVGALEQPELYPLAGLYFNLALEQLEKDREGEALVLLEKVLSLAPQKVDARRLLADLYARRGDWQEAVAGFEEVLSAAPEDIEARRYLHALYVNRGLEHLQRNERASAQPLFERSLALVPGDPSTLYYLAFLDYQARRYALAGERASLAYPGLSPDLRDSAGELLVECARVLRQGGDAAAAASLLAPVLAENDPPLAALEAAGEVYLSLDEPGEAHHVCGRILQRNPAHAFALSCLERSETRQVVLLLEQGGACVEKGDLSGAREQVAALADLIAGDRRLRQLNEEIEAAAARRASEIVALLSEAEAARKKGELLSVRESLVGVLALEPGHRGAAAALEQVEEQLMGQTAAALNAARAAQDQGRWKQARDHYGEVLSLSPADPAALAGLEEVDRREQSSRAELLARARKMAAAGDGAGVRRLLSQEPEVARSPEAQKVLADMDRQRDERLTALVGAAEKASRKNDFDQARRLLEKALILAPGHEEAQKALARLDERRKGRIEARLAESRERLAGDDFAGALQGFRQVLALEPTNREAQVGIEKGRALLGQRIDNLLTAAESDLSAGRWSEAGAAIARILELDPYHAGGRTLQERLARVREVGLQPGDSERLYLEGIELYTSGRYEQAVSAWEKVLLLAPGHEPARRNIERARLKLRQIDERRDG